MNAYREFRIITMIDNRDEYVNRVQLLVTGDNLTPLTKMARGIANDHGIKRLPAFESLPLNPGYRGIYLQALTPKKTGIVITEVFA